MTEMCEISETRDGTGVARGCEEPCEAARRRFTRMEGRPLFLADWCNALFIHYEVDADQLAAAIPFPLDDHEGRAFVSLVAFTQTRLRPALAPRVGRWMFWPLSHSFLNVRTYVRVNGEPGIHFIAEWVPSRIAHLLGPRVYGLPYRLGRLRYRSSPSAPHMSGRVRDEAGAASLAFDATPTDTPPLCCPAGSLDAFLLERYTAFTFHRGIARLFRIWHEPWRQRAATVHIDDSGLMACSGGWSKTARFVGANYAEAARDIRIGRPRRVLSCMGICHAG